MRFFCFMLHFSFLLVITVAKLSAECLIVVSFQPLEYSCHAEVGIQILCLKTHSFKCPEAVVYSVCVTFLPRRNCPATQGLGSGLSPDSS